jgi:hypothetical protein
LNSNNFQNQSEKIQFLLKTHHSLSFENFRWSCAHESGSGKLESLQWEIVEDRRMLIWSKSKSKKFVREVKSLFRCSIETKKNSTRSQKRLKSDEKAQKIRFSRWKRKSARASLEYRENSRQLLSSSLEKKIKINLFFSAHWVFSILFLFFGDLKLKPFFGSLFLKVRELSPCWFKVILGEEFKSDKIFKIRPILIPVL